jgi:branched-subunit amino acid transport protein AzlD
VIGVAAGLATANVLLFLPSFIYAARGKAIRLIDTLEAMLPCVVLTILTVGAVWALRIFVPQEWHPFARLLATGALIGVIMMCGTALVYGRSVLSRRSFRSELP